jgi:hypothetical protein
MLNDSHLHAGIGLYSTRNIPGVAKHFCERVYASFRFFHTNGSDAFEIMMSSSISIHIPFIAKIIDFLVPFSLAHNEMSFSREMRIFPTKNYFSLLCVCELRENEALNIYG